MQHKEYFGAYILHYVVADELLFLQLQLIRYLLNRAGLFHAGGYPLHGLDCPACLRQLCLAHSFLSFIFVRHFGFRTRARCRKVKIRNR